MSSDTEFLAEEIQKKLRGTAIRNAIISDDGEEVGFQVVRKSKGRGNYDVINVWISCDPEGNGPGWLHIENHNE